MRTQKLPGTDADASVIVLGAAWYGTDIDETTSFQMLDSYVEQGGNLIDTANMYCNWVDGCDGRSETTIGTWLRNVGTTRPLIMTKGADRGMDRATIRQQFTESCDRLGLDSVDYYWLHRDDPRVPVGEILGWLNELVGEGAFPSFGCSNWQAGRVREALLYAKENGLKAFSANQIGWSCARIILEAAPVAQLFMNDDFRALHSETGIACMAFSAQAGGFFGGKYGPRPRINDVEPNPAIVKLYGSDENHERIVRAERLAGEHGATPNQVALAYLWSHRFPGFAIAGAGNLDQLSNSCEAGALILSQSECAYLDLCTDHP